MPAVILVMPFFVAFLKPVFAFRMLFMLFFAVFLASIIVTVIAALPPMIFAALAMAFSALMLLVALLAAFLAAAPRPGDGMNFADGLQRIIAVYDHLARMRLALRGFVAYDHVKAGSRVKRRGEWIVDQVPVTVFVLERDLADMQLAFTHIAD
jgi:hypothetical protein